METDDLLGEVKDAAREVYRILGDGRNESVYELAMAKEFRLRKLSYRVQDTVEIMYKGERVGGALLDFVVDERLVVELKAGGSITKGHIAQARAYMRQIGLNDGIIINFPTPLKDAPEFEIFDAGGYGGGVSKQHAPNTTSGKDE